MLPRTRGLRYRKGWRFLAEGAEGVAFLEANGKKPGVVTLPSGLQYKVLRILLLLIEKNREAWFSTS